MNLLATGALIVLIATAIAAAVEWVEALTIVLAVGLFKGWKSALIGMFLGIGLLLAIVVVFVFLGAAATKAVPLSLARFLVGLFLLLFGIRWLHKAMLRSAGLVALRDENQEFEELHHELGEGGVAAAAIDWRGVSTSFNGVLLEGLEVVFIVIALAGANNLPAASLGALISLVIVVIAGVIVHQPLSRVPENLMKYVVGVMLTAFGTFFAGEGLGIEWWHADLVLLPLIGGYALVSVILVWALRRSPRVAGEPSRPLKILRAIGEEVWGLFVGDGPLAIATVAAIAVIGVIVAHWQGGTQVAGVLLAAAVVVALMIGLGEAFTQMRHRRDKIGRYATAPPETAASAEGSPGVTAVASPQRGA
jgi:Ca2+/H+ antiporter, TMEM165/GDT1 family